MVVIYEDGTTGNTFGKEKEMAIGEYIFKKSVRKLAGKVIKGEDAITKATHNFLTSISFGQILGLLARKVVGWLK